MSLSVNEVMLLIVAIGVVGIGVLIREFGKCAEETAEAIDESFDEATQREDWNK